MREKYSVKRTTVKNLLEDLESGKISVEHPIQRRGGQWKTKQKSLFIDSLLTGYVCIPAFHFMEEKLEDGTEKEWILDGKQKLLTIKEYLDSKFTLSKDFPSLEFEVIRMEEVETEEGKKGRKPGPKPVKKVETVKFKSKKFKDLDKEVQAAVLKVIESINIDKVIYPITEYTEEQIEDVFLRLNNGTPLTMDQKLKGQLGAGNLKSLNDLLKGDIFDKYINLTEGQERKDEGLTVLLQSLMLISGYEFANFSSSSVNRFANKIRLYGEIVEEKLEKGLADDVAKAEAKKQTKLTFDVDEVIAKLEDTIVNLTLELETNVSSSVPIHDKTAKIINFKKLNVPMIVAGAANCKGNYEGYGKFLIDFFNNYDTNTEYKKYCEKSTASKDNVNGRYEYILTESAKYL